MKGIRLFSLSVFFISFGFLHTTGAQFSFPHNENLYGGFIQSIAAVNVPLTSGNSKTRLFVSASSPNCLSYMDVVYQNGIPDFGKFQVIPAYNSSTGNGRQIQGLWPHEKSGYVFLREFNGNNPYQLKKVNINSSAPEIVSDNLLTAFIQGDYFFFLETGKFHFGMVDVNGNYTEGKGSPIAMPEFSDPLEEPTIQLNPVDNKIYIFRPGSSPTLLKFSDTYNSMDSTTTYKNVMPAGLNSIYVWNGFGIAPDGKYFIHAFSPAQYGVNGLSVNGASWHCYSSDYSDYSGYVFGGDSSNYYAYNGSGYNFGKGSDTCWHFNGEPGGTPTSASGPGWPVVIDPNNYKVIYFRTEIGVGVSTDRGSSILPQNDGLESVEVYSLDMIKDQNFGWAASSAGLRKVTNFQVNPAWGDPVQIPGHPMTFRSVCLDKNNYNTIYAGLENLYKSGDGGKSWNKVFSAVDTPYNYDPTAQIFSIAVCDFDPNLVAAGYQGLQNVENGLFASMNGGKNWEQILLRSSKIGNDFSINKILFNYENGDTVLYACNSNISELSGGNTIFRVVKRNNKWVPSFDMSADKTVSGEPITAGIKDICKNSDGSVLYAVGFDESQQYIGSTVYYKTISTGKWDRMSKKGLPIPKEPRAIAFGNDKIYCALENNIYYIDINGSIWELGYSYSVDNYIYFLYYDDLLVGSSTGLYGHSEDSVSSVNKSNKNENPASFKIYQNYPNPFNPTTTINYSIPKACFVTLKVYDILGREAATLVNEQKNAGNYSVQFAAGSKQLASGIYIYRIQAGNFVESKKLILMK